ncbi:uncharacterized protein METZ01_LOCUS505129, partial [marine metagenome]
MFPYHPYYNRPDPNARKSLRCRCGYRGYTLGKGQKAQS